MTKNEKQGLINETGLPILNHRSLECHPCIHSSLDELTNLNINEIAKIARLEQKISQAMFQGRYPHNDINTLLQTANLVQTQAENTSLEQFDLGCGSRYVCGE
jgi:hypothetical protein